jgi:hypothetical protein
LPSARQKTLGKKVFVDEFFAKAFTEFIYDFAECPEHSAKRLIPVV